jgi:hypothetical protein
VGAEGTPMIPGVSGDEAALVLGITALAAFVTVWAAVHQARNRNRVWCQSRSTAVGTGYDARPAGLRCRRGAGHRGDHNAVTPDGRLWYWCDE